MSKKVVGLIPIKLRNQRLPGKNIKPLGENKVLCQYLFETLMEVKNIDEVYVYCSDDSIMKYIPQGIKFLKRNVELDSDSVKSKQILDSFMNEVDADIYALMHVTQPFIKAETIISAIDKVLNDSYDSAFVANEIKEFTWYKGKTLNYSLDNVVRTQELEPVYIEGELFIFEKQVLKQLGRRIGNKPFIQPISWKESVCIDDQDDFDMARAIVELEKNNK